MTSEASKQLVAAYSEAWNSGDGEALAAILADDLEWVIPATAFTAPDPNDPVVRGREAVLELQQQAASAFYRLETIESKTHKMIAEGDTVVAQVELSCIAHNGNPYRNRYVIIYTCADGKIVRMEEYADTAYWERTILPAGFHAMKAAGAQR